MNQNRSSLGVVRRFDPSVEGQHGRGIVWHSVVRPGSEVKLLQLVRSVATLKLRGREWRERGSRGREWREGGREGGKERVGKGNERTALGRNVPHSFMVCNKN